MTSLRGLEETIVGAGARMLETLRQGGGVFVAGNGGSAADAQHFAAELVGRFQRERPPYRATALTTDTSILTAVGNDYGFDAIFARQLGGLARPGDVFLGISTSGNSPNIMRAVETARQMGVHSIGLLGKDGGALGSQVDSAVIVPATVTALIQEAHEFILHFWAEWIETKLAMAEA